ncbi:hypothetical protein D3C73_1274350 [compost metagenome]
MTAASHTDRTMIQRVIPGNGALAPGRSNHRNIKRFCQLQKLLVSTGTVHALASDNKGIGGLIDSGHYPLEISDTDDGLTLRNHNAAFFKPFGLHIKGEA